MTYNEFIQNIIDTRGQWSDEVKYSDRGCERHHIVPKCMGGKPNTKHYNDMHPNIIWLYPSEHFIAHKLLALENITNVKLVKVFMAMCNLKMYRDIDINNYDLITPEEYEHIRSNYIQSLKNIPQTEESNIKRSNTMKSKKLVWYYNGIEEHRYEEDCQPEGYFKGRKPISDETREKFKNRPKPIGEKNGMYGKHNSLESNKKRSEWSSARSWFNNGVKEVFEIECPQGYVKGRLCGYSWFTNDVVEVWGSTCPEGFHKGRLKRKDGEK